MKSNISDLNLQLEKYSIDIVNKWGMTRLHYAAKNGSLPGVKLLIALDASVNIKDREMETPLHVAAYNNHTKIVEYLLANGAEDNINVHGFTALQYALLMGHGRIYELILKYATKEDMATMYSFLPNLDSISDSDITHDDISLNIEAFLNGEISDNDAH